MPVRRGIAAYRLLRTQHFCCIVGAMSDPIADFANECETHGVSPLAALKEGGVHPTMWWRWKSGAVSPTLKSFQAAKDGLKRLTERSAA